MIGTDSPENRSTAAGSGRGVAASNTPPGATGRPARMLAIATVGFALTFWAWALLSPLGATLREQLALTAFQQSLLVAVPVIVGSLGRIPVGALTDRLGARRMFPVVALLTVLPVLYLGHFADSLTGYLIGGFFLGLGGTTFAIGIPFVNSWYPPARRGLALGIFGVGMGGTAISAFTTVQLTKAIGPSFPFDLVAVVLVVYAAAAYLLLRDRADRPVAARVHARHGSRPRCGCRSTCSCRSSTPSRSAASSRSACTCPPTSPPPTTSTAATPPCAPPGSSCSPSPCARSAAGCATGCARSPSSLTAFAVGRGASPSSPRSSSR